MRQTIVYDNGDELIRKILFLTIIGYANGEAYFICDDWIDRIANSYPIKQTDFSDNEGRKYVLDVISVLEPKADGFSGMDLAFTGANEFLQYWFKSRYNDIDEVPPMIINITSGVCMGDTDKLRKCAKEIIGLQFPDGSPILINIHMSSEINNLPDSSFQSSDDKSNVLLSISSVIDEDIRNRLPRASTKSLFNLNGGEKKERFLFLNVLSSNELYKICDLITEYFSRI